MGQRHHSKQYSESFIHRNLYGDGNRRRLVFGNGISNCNRSSASFSKRIGKSGFDYAGKFNYADRKRRSAI